jgi:hypothetical protein
MNFVKDRRIMLLRTTLAALSLSAGLATGAIGAQVQLDSAAVPPCRLVSAVPIERAAGWPAGRYFRVDFAGMASDTIVVNGYRADVVMLDNSSPAGRHYAVARLPADAAMTTGFITFTVAARTALGYTPAVPLKIVLDER